MNRKFLHILKQCGPMITQDLEPKDIYAYLVSEEWLSDDDCELIDAEPTRKRRAVKFLSILHGRPSGAFECFHKSLEHEAPHLARVISQQLQSYSATQ